MATSVGDEIAAVGEFLRASKVLSGPAPEFGPTKFHTKGAYEWCAKWPVADDLGIVRGEMRFATKPGSDEQFSISLIFQGHAVARLDFADETECHPNPHWASQFSVPGRVCGPHLHVWELNKEHVAQTGAWTLPVRTPLPPQIRRFSQALPWFADRVNVVLTPEQRGFDMPKELV